MKPVNVMSNWIGRARLHNNTKLCETLT